MNEGIAVTKMRGAAARRRCLWLQSEGWKLIQLDGRRARDLDSAHMALNAAPVCLVGAGSWDALDDTLPYIRDAETNPWDRFVLVWEYAEKLKSADGSAYASVVRLLEELWRRLGAEPATRLAEGAWRTVDDTPRPVWFLTVMAEGDTGIKRFDGEAPWLTHMREDLGDILDE